MKTSKTLFTWTIAPLGAAALLGLPDRDEIAAADFFIVDGDPTSHIPDLRRINSVWRGERQVSCPDWSFLALV